MSFILKLSGNSRNWYSNIPRTQTPDSMCYIILDTHKVTELFFDMDEFTILLGQFQPRIGKPGPAPGLAMSESMAIMAIYHFSGMSCFKFYYKHFIKGVLRGYFPRAPSYERFVATKAECVPFLLAFLLFRRLGEETGTYFGDSTKLGVCHNKRAKRNKTFKGIARSGKSTMGWFFGFKLHLIINQFGEIVRFMLTPGNVADNNKPLLKVLFGGLKGECYLDKGYLSTLFEEFFEAGIKLITPIRDNMKNVLMDMREKVNLRKRSVIETVNGMLKEVLDICHTRHRKPENFLANLFGGLIAYSYLDKKPNAKVNQKNEIPTIVLI